MLNLLDNHSFIPLCKARDLVVVANEFNIVPIIGSSYGFERVACVDTNSS